MQLLGGLKRLPLELCHSQKPKIFVKEHRSTCKLTAITRMSITKQLSALISRAETLFSSSVMLLGSSDYMVQ